MSAGSFAAELEHILSGAVPDAEIAQFLTALADRGETVDDIVTAATVLRGRMTTLSAPANTIDVCGTGGDHAGTVNISTAVALVVAACGVPVAKHGNRAASSLSGATDVLQALGIPTDLPVPEAERQLSELGITFLTASQYHPALARLAPIRKAIGRRTIFNLLGPLLNPAGVSRQLVGVYSTDRVEIMTAALARLGSHHAWVVNGGGLDELTTTEANTVAMLENGNIAVSTLEPLEFGIPRSDSGALQGGSPRQNAASLMRLMEGERGAYRDIVLLNSAAGLIVAGLARLIDDGLDLARNALDSGAALTLLRKLQHDSPHER